MEHEFGGPPYDGAAAEASSPYVRCTPSAKVARWETPTRAIHGAFSRLLSPSPTVSHLRSPALALQVSRWETPTLVIHGAKDFRLVESEVSQHALKPH